MIVYIPDNYDAFIEFENEKERQKRLHNRYKAEEQNIKLSQ